MATHVAPSPHSFASVLANMHQQGYLTPWEDDEDVEELPSPTRPVASYGHHERSGSISSSSSRDSFYTLYDEPLDSEAGASAEMDERSETPKAREDSEPRKQSVTQPVEAEPGRGAPLDEPVPESTTTATMEPAKPIMETRKSTAAGSTEVLRESTRTPSLDSVRRFSAKNSILVSTTTTVQTTPPGSLTAERVRRTPPRTETVIAANVDKESPIERIAVDYSKPLRRQSTRPPLALPISQIADPQLPTEDFDHIITEEELQELEKDITPRPRPRTKNLAKIFGQDPKHTYPSPLPSPMRTEAPRRQGSLPENATPPLVRPTEFETSESHIGDIRKKIAWRPTALSSAEEEADRRDLAKLLGEDRTLVAKIFGDDDAGSTRKASSEKCMIDEMPRNELLNDRSSSDWRRRPVWRSTAISETEREADVRDLHELMLGNVQDDMARRMFDDPRAFEEALPTGITTTTEPMETGPSHERTISGPPVIPRRVTSAKRASMQSFVTDGAVHSQPATVMGTSTPPRPGTASTVTAATAHGAVPGIIDSGVEADISSRASSPEAHFSTFSGVFPAAQDEPSIPTTARPPSERSSSRAATPSGLAGSVRRLTAYVNPIRDIFRFNDSHGTAPSPRRTDSLSSDSTISDMSDSASPELLRPESPLSDEEGAEAKSGVEAEHGEADTTPPASAPDANPSSKSRHQHQPSASTVISSISSSSTGKPPRATSEFDSGDEVSIISAHDLSQPPPHIIQQALGSDLPNPLSSHSPHSLQLIPRPHTAPSSAPGPTINHNTRMPLTARPPSPSVSLDSAAPPPIALVRPSPDGSLRRRRRPLGIIRQALLRRPSTHGALISRSKSSSNVSATSITSSSSAAYASERGSSERRSTEKKAVPRPRPVFDEVALQELLSQSIPYEQAARGQTPFTSKQAAGVYPHGRRRKGGVPLGLELLGEWEINEMLAKQRAKRHEALELQSQSGEVAPAEMGADGESRDGEHGEHVYGGKRLSSVLEEN